MMFFSLYPTDPDDNTYIKSEQPDVDYTLYRTLCDKGQVPVKAYGSGLGRLLFNCIAACPCQHYIQSLPTLCLKESEITVNNGSLSPVPAEGHRDSMER